MIFIDKFSLHFYDTSPHQVFFSSYFSPSISLRFVALRENTKNITTGVKNPGLVDNSLTYSAV